MPGSSCPHGAVRAGADQGTELSCSLLQYLKTLGIKVKHMKHHTCGLAHPVASPCFVFDRLKVCRRLVERRPSSGLVFGNSLHALPQYSLPDGSGSIPRFLMEACSFLSQHVHTEGIFRKSGSALRMKSLRGTSVAGTLLAGVGKLGRRACFHAVSLYVSYKELDKLGLFFLACGRLWKNLVAVTQCSSPLLSPPQAKLQQGVCSLELSSVSDVAGLLKQFFRELPEPIVPAALHGPLCQAQRMLADEERSAVTILLTCLIPSASVGTLRYLLSFLQTVAARYDTLSHCRTSARSFLMAARWLSGRVAASQRSRFDPEYGCCLY
ncbi:inactive Rho GTPase-activating protein 11B-like [Leucoraja erinacea]|uniref:inactive Rho GTPase-activating protein 11B-like n=1 Tax=Leucoraja erinaceus TaxID=7782 RepID=UPI0024539C90|nr:inactive Rho GTPase-activating protein 11B-like [Leucoraja erinacea]